MVPPRAQKFGPRAKRIFLFLLYWLDEHRGENEEECVGHDDDEYQRVACRSANHIQHQCQKKI